MLLIKSLQSCFLKSSVRLIVEKNIFLTLFYKKLHFFIKNARQFYISAQKIFWEMILFAVEHKKSSGSDTAYSGKELPGKFFVQKNNSEHHDQHHAEFVDRSNP